MSTGPSQRETARPTKSRRWFHRHPKLALSLFAAVVILIIDVSVGSTLYAFGRRPTGGSLEAGYRIRHPVFHHTLRPSTSTQGQWGATVYDVRTDSLGFRNSGVRDIPLKGPGKRLLLIGDSFAEGIGVKYPDTFAGMLSERLADQDIEVLNAAVVSYSPIIYLRKIEHLVEQTGLRFDKVIVFIDMSDIEDEARFYQFDAARNVVRDTGLDDSLKQFIQDKTVLLGALRRLIHGIRHMNDARVVDSCIGRHRCLWANDAADWQAYGETGLARATEHMDSLHAFLETHGIELAVAVYPWPDQIARQDADCLQVRHWREWTTKKGVGFIDCFPSFVNDTPANEVIEQCFIPGDVHWNRTGHRRIADQVMAYLSKSG